MSDLTKEKSTVEIQLETLQADRSTFKAPDPRLKEIIDTVSRNCHEAARELGLEWRGMFNVGHVLLIAKAYALKRDGDREHG